MKIDPLTDELFLRLVLERQPGEAKSGKKRAVWEAIAQAVNEASGCVVFPTTESPIRRLSFLSTVLDDAGHALHGALSREMRVMLREIRGDVEAPEPATTAPGRVRTRSQIHASGDAASSRPPPTKRTRTKQNSDNEGDAKPPAKATPTAMNDAGDDLAAAARPPPITTMALVPYATVGTQLSLDQFFGAQAERDRQACYEREQLRRELTECKRESAALGREVALLHHGVTRRGAVRPAENAAVPVDDGAPLATTMVVRLLEEITTEQRLAREDMRSERASHRQQVAAMIALLQQQQQQQAQGRLGVDALGEI